MELSIQPQYIYIYIQIYTQANNIHMNIYIYYIVSKELLLKGLCGGLCGIVGRTTIWRTIGNMYLYLLLFSKFLPANAAHMCQICSYLVHLGPPGSLHTLLFANLCLFTPLSSKSYPFTYRFLLGMYHMRSQIDLQT